MLCEQYTNQSKKIQVETDEVLRDIRKNGKEFDWKGRKIKNLQYFDILNDLHFIKAKRVRDCAEVLEFLENEDGTLRLDRVWFCKSKLCPVCNWRRSMKLAYQNAEIITEAMKREPKGRFLFLTLTAKNVYDGQELKERLSEMTKAFNRLFKYKKVDKNLIGFLRTTEITVNPVDNSYNQHFHVLLMVKSTYFKDSDNYITQAEWTKLWQRALQVDYTPIVNIKAVKAKDGTKNDPTNAILETSKYAVKDSDYLTDDDEKNKRIVEDLETGLFGKRQLAYGKLFKTIRKELQLDDVEDGDLSKVGDEDLEKLDENAKRIVAQFDFERKNYYIKK